MVAFKDGDHYQQVQLIYTLGASVYRLFDFGFYKNSNWEMKYLIISITYKI